VDLSIGSTDDLATFALDALETSELKAVEARLDGQPTPPELETWRQALGEVATLAAEEPPTSLRREALSRAQARRPSGASLHQPDDLPANEAFIQTIDALGRLLSELSPEDWSAPTIEGWTVKGLVAHLVAVEEYFGRQLGLWPLEIDKSLEADHLGMTRAFVEEWSDRPAREVLARWRERTAAITSYLRSLDRAAGRRQIHFHFLDTSLSTVLITRVFEVWTHDEDIRRATGRPALPPDPARLARMSRIAVPSLPFGLMLSGLEGDGRTVRVVLTGAGGGTWDQALDLGQPAGEPEATVVVDVVDYCRLAARRVTAAEVDAVIEGDRDLARKVLVGAGVFSA
jgi:uncharacterized protein (TIGR03083 family)